MIVIPACRDTEFGLQVHSLHLQKTASARSTIEKLSQPHGNNFQAAGLFFLYSEWLYFTQAVVSG
jgi:hypothetical protein